MNCRDIEPLLLAERDGVLTVDQRAALEQHVAGCAGCRQLRDRLAGTLAAFQADAAGVAIPDVNEEWRELRAQISGEAIRPARKRPLAPVIWFSAPLAAAAALALAYLGFQTKPQEPVATLAGVARTDRVESDDAKASTMVYVDKESGWLVVWAADEETATKG